MNDREAKQLLDLLVKYQDTYGPEDNEIADGTIRLRTVIEDLQQSIGLGG